MSESIGTGNGRVCLLMSRFPERSETFIFREAKALKKLGLDLLVQPVVKKNDR